MIWIAPSEKDTATDIPEEPLRNGIRNKGQAIPARDLDTARARMRDWQERSET